MPRRHPSPTPFPYTTLFRSAEQRAAAATPGGVDRDDRDLELVLLVDAQPADELVGERRLAGAAGPRDAEHRDRPPARSEEHTSELQSRRDLVCRLLLEKKNM